MPAATRPTHHAAGLPQLHVTQSDLLQYDMLATRLVNKAVTRYSQFNGYIDTDDWKFVRRRRQMSVYRAIRGAVAHTPHVTLMTGSGLIHGSLEDVMDGLYSDTTDDLRAAKTQLHYKLLDAAVLHVSQRRSVDTPFRFAGIKWVAAKAAWGLVKHRELLTYERMGTIRDVSGREFAYHTIQSIDRAEWPPNAAKGVKRATTSTCYLFQRLPDSRVEVFLWGEFFDTNSISHRAAEYTVAGLWLKVVYSVDCTEAKRYSKMMPRDGATRPQAGRDVCHICFKSPGVFETPRQCSSCLHSVCKACSCRRATFEVDARTGKPMQRRFCKLCASKALPAVPTQANRLRFTTELEAEIGSGKDEQKSARSKSRSVGTPPDLRMLAKHNKLYLKETTAHDGSEYLDLAETLAADEAAVMAKEEATWTTSKLGDFDLGVVSEAVDANKRATESEAEAQLTGRRSTKYERLSQQQQKSPAMRWQYRIESGLFN